MTGIADDLQGIRTPIAVPDDQPDERSRQELRHQHEAADLERKRLQNQSLRDDIKARKKYADSIFQLVCCWLVVVLLLLCANGLKCGFSLSDGVLIAVISGTTANVLGLFLVVANYFFPKRSVGE